MEATTQVEATQVGAIWNTSWGYDQTNVEFFQVVRETEKSIWLRAIGARIQDGRLYPEPDNFTVDFGLMDDQRSRERDEARGYSEKVCRKPRNERYQSVRIDDVRYAWPYKGGGCYETGAAGLPGH